MAFERQREDQNFLWPKGLLTCDGMHLPGWLLPVTCADLSYRNQAVGDLQGRSSGVQR